MKNVVKKKKQPKKIVQFFIGGFSTSWSSPYGTGSENRSKSSTKVWALCDDGTLWSKLDDGTAEAVWVPEAVL